MDIGKQILVIIRLLRIVNFCSLKPVFIIEKHGSLALVAVKNPSYIDASSPAYGPVRREAQKATL
ncbi:MAG: hypothetical protein V4691_01955 [Pseudomonadota bacterium]